MLLPLASLRVRVLIISLALTGTVLLAASIPWQFASAAKSSPAHASPVPLASPEQSFVRKVDVVANDLVVDPITQTIYVSLPSSSLPNGNSIAPVTPLTGAVGPSVFLGSEPTKMAVSDNGQFIYALLNGSASIRRFEIATQTAGLQFSLGHDSSGSPLSPVDLAVQPFNPNTLAILRQGGSSGIGIYDDGVPRNTTVNAFATTFSFSNLDASRLYGLSGGTLIRMLVNSNGVIQAGTTSVFAGGGVRFDNGRLYTSSGQVLDPETGTLFGTFTGTNINNSTTFTTDSALNRAFYLTAPGFSGTQTLTLRVYDTQTFVLVGTLDIPNVVGAPTRIVRWGSNGLAFCSNSGQLYIIQTTLVSSGDPIPTPTPTPTATPTPTPVPTPGPNELRQISLPTNDLVALPNGQTIFASVPSSGGGNGNSLTPINPVAGTVGQSVFVGSEPNKLAISSEGQTIYVGLDGANAVRPFDVQTLTPGTQFTLGSDPFFGPNRAEDIAVAPDQPGVVAVSLLRPNVSPRHGGVAVYDNGVQRGLPTASHTGSNAIEFSNSPGVLYGYNNETTEFGFRRIAVASCGPVIVRTTSGLFGGFGVDFKYANGVAYSTGGRVINPEAASIVGIFLLQDPNSFSFNSPLVLPDPQAGRIYFILDDQGAVFLRVFDSKTFLKLGEVRLPGVSGTLRGLVKWGANGIAFRSPTTVYLLQNGLIGGTDPTFTPAPIESPATASLTVNVSSFNGDPGGVTINVTGSTTTSGTTDSAGRLTFTGLPPCGGFTFTPSKPNYTFNPTSITVNSIASSPNVNFTATLKTVSFQQSSTTVSESATKVSLLVTRNFSNSPATVNYETAVGTASDRSDFNTTLGTLQFASGELSKFITVLLNNDTLVEGPEAFTVILKDPSEGVLTSGFSTITVNITDNDTQPGALNPLNDVAFFVRQHYTDFLNREPDAPGLAFWMDQITSCPDAQCREIRRINVSAAFFLAIEFQETGYFVYRMNKAGFGNLPGAPVPVRFTDFLRDSQRIAQGVQVGVGNWQAQLEANKQAFTLAFVQRSEFLAAFPNTMTATQFVDQLNTNAGGALSPGERDTLIATLTTPADVTQRAAVTRAVADDQDLRNAELNKAFVLTQYFGYLRRNPNDAPNTNFDGWQFWLNKLNQFNGNFVQAEMVKSFLVSGEYQLRFGAANFNLSQ